MGVGEAAEAPPAPEKGQGGRKRILVLVLIAVIIIAAVGIGAVLLLRSPTSSPPPPPGKVMLSSVTVASTTGATSLYQVQSVHLLAAAKDTQGRDETRNATFRWTASPTAAVTLTPSVTVSSVAAVQGLVAGPVTITSNASWNGSYAQGQLSLTVNVVRFQVTSTASFPLVGSNFTLTVKAVDQGGATVTSYNGTVHFSQDYPNLTLPADTTFLTSDAGIHNFLQVPINQGGRVTITATDTVASTVTGSLQITGNRPPVAAFTVTFNPADPLQITVNGSQSYDPDAGDSIAFYTWAFGDGAGGSGVTSSHSYAASSTYVITLSVRDTHGALNSSQQTYTSHAPPTAIFWTILETPVSGTQTQVLYSANDSVAGEGHIVNYTWTFGDGTPATMTTLPYVWHTYAAAYSGSVVPVDLVVLNNYSVSNTSTKNILISTAAVIPIANFTYVYTFTNKSVTTDASRSYSPAGYKLVSYAWSWGDGSPLQAGPSPKAFHAFAATGTFTILLTITDSIGTTNTTSHVVVVAVPQLPPVAIFNVTRSLLSVHVDANLSYDINNNIANYSWDWGDGLKSGPNVVAWAAHTYATAGFYTITLTVEDTTNLTGTATRHVSVATSTLDYRMYDFFNVPYHDWWDMRTIYPYGDEPLNANCFNASSLNEVIGKTPVCTKAYPAQPVNSSYPYTNWYPSPFGLLKYNNPNNDPLIYAPYRFHAIGVAQPGYNVSEPVFLPVLNYSQPADTSSPLTFDWHFQYLTYADWSPVSACIPFKPDGFMAISYLNVTSSLAESRRLFKVPSSVTPSTAQAWWNSNAAWFPCSNASLAQNTAITNWFKNEGNGKYDVYNSFQYSYTPFFTMVRATVNPSTGQTTVEIAHASWGTDVLLSRWFYWGNASYANDIADSTLARGWWGMELAWFEDFHYSGSLSAAGLDFGLDTAMEYQFEENALPGPDGYLNQVNDQPSWIWWPVLSDYITQASHPSELTRYAGQTYLHSTPGGMNYNKSLGFDYTPISWKPRIGETWHFDFPRGKVPWYDPNNVTIPQDPHAYASTSKHALAYAATYPSNYGYWDAQNVTWDVFGGEPTSFNWPCGCPGGYPLVPSPSIWFVPNYGAAALVGPTTRAPAAAPSSLPQTVSLALSVDRASGSSTATWIAVPTWVGRTSRPPDRR